ncbi:hypothetical protein Chor_005003 [Crotalus horridus]
MSQAASKVATTDASDTSRGTWGVASNGDGITAGGQDGTRNGDHDCRGLDGHLRWWDLADARRDDSGQGAQVPSRFSKPSRAITVAKAIAETSVAVEVWNIKSGSGVGLVWEGEEKGKGKEEKEKEEKRRRRRRRRGRRKRRKKEKEKKEEKKKEKEVEEETEKEKKKKNEEKEKKEKRKEKDQQNINIIKINMGERKLPDFSLKGMVLGSSNLTLNPKNPKLLCSNRDSCCKRIMILQGNPHITLFSFPF